MSKDYSKLPDNIRNPPMFFDWDGNPIGLRTWCELFEGDRQLALTEVELPGGQKAMVSTIYMGINRAFLDGGPINIFETGLFWEAGDFETFDGEWRWPTRDAALAGHDQVIAYAHNLGLIPLEKVDE